MTAPDFQRVEEIFHAALECEPNQLDAFLNEKCAGDEILRREVEALLALHRRAANFIETPIVDVAASLLKEDETDLLIGQTIGQYKISQRISAGGMGAVYLAERADRQYEKQVAIKLIKRGMDTDSVLRHFRNERQILASFDHPNIARLLDGGATESGLPYFVMDYVEGLPIDAYCDAHALSIVERLKLFREVCAAVSYAHRHTVIHRDIKPSNILVTSDGTPKLLDFGIARILQPAGAVESLATLTGVRLMTPHYASPEQVRGQALTTATDVYSLGVVLYQLLTGRKPYRLKTRTPEEISRAILEQEPLRPSTTVAKSDGSGKSQIPNPKLLRGDLDNIVLMALRKEPERRYRSVEQLSEDIRRHLEARPVVARKDTVAYRAAKFVRRNPALAGAATVCVLLAMAVVWFARERFTAPETPAPQKSIAVLPFENLSADPANAYFADGIQEEILNRLSKIADLKVISRTSTQRYKSKPTDLREISKQLEVAHVLEGSVQKAADQVRVNVQLINAQTDAHLWADKYDRKLTDIFAVESEIAAKVAENLQAKLTGSEQTATAVRPTEDPEAHELYLKGRYVFARRTHEDTLKAIDYYNQAINKDPNYAAAYAGLAESYALLPAFSRVAASEPYAKARDAAEKALSLDNDLGEAHAALGLMKLFTDFNFREARREFERAIALNPNYSPAYFFLGAFVQTPLGQFDAAITELKRGLKVDPVSPLLRTRLGMCYVADRRFAEGIDYLRKTVELNPAYAQASDVLAIALGLSGDLDGAIAQFQKTFQVTGGDFHCVVYSAHFYGLKGEREKALEALERGKRLQQQIGAEWAYGYAVAFAGIGDKEQALKWLERSYQAKEYWLLLSIRVDPLLASLRGEPRFEKLANQIVPRDPERRP